MNEIYQSLEKSLNEEKLFALATVVKGPSMGNKLLIFPNGRKIGDLGSQALNDQTIEHTIYSFEKMETGRANITVAGEMYDVFIDMYSPPQKMYIIGAVHIAIFLVTFAKACGFHTAVIDARGAFATEDRFPHTDELIVGWPSEELEKLLIDESTYIVMLTHDEKFDNPALKVALESKARYIGALGSKKTHAKRIEALKEMGMVEEKIARIHAPIGLSIGARGPEEIALAIMAEIVAISHGVKV